jgi:hypothetical protein
MKRILFLAAIACIAITCSSTSVHAQDLNSGYGFGVGLGYRFPNQGSIACQGFPNFFTGNRIEEPPYFAKFPPVYYSHIVRRPYGVSPYAAPPGIEPVEMRFQPPVVAQRVVNPYYQPAKTTTETVIETEVPAPMTLNANESEPVVESETSAEGN